MPTHRHSAAHAPRISTFPPLSPSTVPPQFPTGGKEAPADVRPPSFAGACPKLLNFYATITVNGPCTVTYKWERSDNAMAPTNSITFAAAGSQTVSTTWQIGAD